MKKLLSALAFLLVLHPLTGATLKETAHGEYKIIRVDSPFYTVEVAPESGGRIVRWLDKIKKAEMIRPCLPLKKSDKIDFGGMLDDRSSMTLAQYECVCGEEDGTVTVRMRGTRADGLEINKKLIFPPDKPLVTVEYRFVNRSTREVSGLASGNRNFIMPGGSDKASPDWVYIVPTNHIIRRRAGFTFRMLDGSVRPPEMQSRLWCQLSAPWIALLHGPREQGMAVSFRDNGYYGSFAWKGGIEYPTWEWSFCPIPAGHERKIVFDLIQVDGMKMLSCATEQFLADMRCTIENGKLKIETKIAALENLPALRLTTSIEQIGGKFRIDPPVRRKASSGSEARFDANPDRVDGEAVPKLERGKTVIRIREFKLPASGLFKITQTLYHGTRKFAVWRDVVTPDHTPFVPAMDMEHRSIGENIPLTGWQSAPADKLEVSSESRKRGFALTESTPQSKILQDTYYTSARPPQILKEIPELKIRIAANEITSREIVVLPLSMIGGGRAVLEGGSEVDAVLKQEIPLAMNSLKDGMGIRYARILFDKLSFPLEDRVSLWLRVGKLEGIKPGTFRFTLKVTADGKTAVLPVKVEVCDVTLPDRPLMSLESEGYPFTFPMKNDPARIHAWFGNMRTHGVDFFQEFGGYDRVLIAGTKRTLAQDMRLRRAFYQKGENLPALDFSPHDVLIDQAIRHGLVRFKACYYGREDPDPVKLHYFAEGAKYIRSKGIQSKDLFFKIRDEQPPDQFPSMVRVARKFKAFGYRPFSTFSRLFAHPEHLKLLEGQFEMFQGGFTTRKERAEIIRKGLIPPDSVVLTYTGVGTCVRSYDDQLHLGWMAAALEHDMFHNHCYMRGGNGRLGGNIVYIDDERGVPLDSVGHEGLRDGMTGGNLVALYREWRKLIGDRKENRALFERCDKIVKGLFEGKDAVLPIETERRMGIEVEVVRQTGRPAYYHAHEIMLDVLLAIAPAARKAAPEVASIRWNGLTLFDRTHTMELKTDRKEIAEFFRQQLKRRTGFTDRQLQNRPDKIPVELKLDPAQTVTYRMEAADGGLRITANSEANLKLGIENFFAVAKMQGFWR